MDEQELLRALLGAVGGALATWLGLHWKIRQGLQAQYDRDLRARRLRAYQHLWTLTEPMARYASPAPVTRETFERMATQLRHWYFHDGGIYLSDEARRAYFALQRALADALATAAGPDALARVPDAAGADAGTLDTWEAVVRRASSALRHALVGDVGARNRPMLRDGEVQANV